MNYYRVPVVVQNSADPPATTDGDGNFVYKPPNNTGTYLAIIGGVLTVIGDTFATIGEIIQLNIDTSSDYQSQVDDFKSDQETEKMQKQIDDLTETVKKLERMIRNNQK